MFRLLDTFWSLFRRRPRDLGARGESLAADYARRTLGYRILATNVDCPHGELDIVALDGDDLVFIEVRTRTSEAFTTPEATIRYKKRRALRRSIRWFVHARRLAQFTPRLDVIAIVHPPAGTPIIRHHKNVAIN